MDGKKAIKEIVERVSQFPPSVGACDITENKYGPKLNVNPSDEMLCPFYFEFGLRDYFLSFGRGGLHFETLQSSEFDPVVVADAIMRGDVRERIWRFSGGIVVRAEGGIKLDHSCFLNTATVFIPFVRRFASMKQIDYQPYPIRAPQ